MAACGHQFLGGDDSDWVFSSSVNCLNGSTTASQILQELFNQINQMWVLPEQLVFSDGAITEGGCRFRGGSPKFLLMRKTFCFACERKHCRSMPSKTPRKRPKTVVIASKNASFSKRSEEMGEIEYNTSPKTENEDLIVKKITRGFENFDESQHLNGCPMKWLYNKKLLDKNKIYKTEKLYSKKPIKREEVKREKSRNLRDKTPIEVKIHKINLIEKYTTNCDDLYTPPYTFPSLTSGNSEKDSKDLETRRKKLAAKLNWKMHNESQDDSYFETSSEISSRHNYLPPRPLLGLKPLLSVLLAPRQETHCCSLISLQNASQKTKNEETSLSVQSINLTFAMPESKSPPRTTNSLRWGSKSSILSKKFQIPNQITIKLDQQKKKSATNTDNRLRVFNYNHPVKKASERTKQTKSLSSLFYELKDKTNYRNQNDMNFEEMIRDFTMKEERFKIKRFLSISSANSDLIHGSKSNCEKEGRFLESSSADGELNLICEKVRFFEKKTSKTIK